MNEKFVLYDSSYFNFFFEFRDIGTFIDWLKRKLEFIFILFFLSNLFELRDIGTLIDWLERNLAFIFIILFFFNIF
jgi:hypothetical protein